MRKSFATETADSIKQATAHAMKTVPKKQAAKPAPAPVEAPKKSQRELTTQLNLRIAHEAREKLRNAAFAWGMTERELLEKLVEGLPEVEISRPAKPASLKG